MVPVPFFRTAQIAQSLYVIESGTDDSCFVQQFFIRWPGRLLQGCAGTAILNG
jgi:hypothetical protein